MATEHSEIIHFAHFDNETTIAAVEEISDGEQKQEIESMIGIDNNDDRDAKFHELEEYNCKERKDRQQRHWSNDWQNYCYVSADNYEQSVDNNTTSVIHRKPKKRLFAHRLQWSNDSMENAMSDVRERNMTLRGAAKKNCVPYSTLKDRIQGRVMHGTKPGVKTVLSPEEENDLALCIQQMEAGGFALHCTNIRELARQMLMMRVTRGFSMPYRDGCPGHNWLAGFLKRHPGMHLKRSLNRNVVIGASKQKQIVRKFFDITSHMYKKCHVQQKPQSIFVVSELKIAAFPHTSAYIACNAEGDPLAPFVVFHSHPTDTSRLTAHSPPEFKDALFFNAKGTHDGDALFVWFRDHFMQWKSRCRSRSVVLFVTCPISEISLRLVQLAEEEHVALIAIPSAVAHLVQPLSYSVLRSINAAVSAGFEQVVTSVKSVSGGLTLSHSLLATLLAEVWAEKWSSDGVRQAFISCGLFPLNVCAISAERIAAAAGDDSYMTDESSDDVDAVTHGLNLLSELSTLEQQKESCTEPFVAEGSQRCYKKVKLEVDNASASSSSHTSREMFQCFSGDASETSPPTYTDISSSIVHQPYIHTGVDRTDNSITVTQKRSVRRTRHLIGSSKHKKVSNYANGTTEHNSDVVAPLCVIRYPSIDMHEQDRTKVAGMDFEAMLECDNNDSQQVCCEVVI